MLLKKSLCLFLIIGFFSLSFPGKFLLAENNEATVHLKAPENIEGVKSLTGKFIQKFPQAFKEAWSKANEIWRKTWFSWWDSHIKPFFQNIWQNIKNFFEDLIDKIKQKRPSVEEEFEKEKKEMGEEIKQGTSKIGEGIWNSLKEKLKGLIRPAE